MKYYLAIDIGASSGRHIISYIDNGKIKYEEIYRFYNEFDEKDGHLVWDIERLFEEIINGFVVCKELDKVPYSIGIDTWGVDYVLLDENDKVIGSTYAYRDKRTEGIDNEVYKIISKEDLYRRTGIQYVIFNTIYQLMATKKYEPETLDKAESLLMIPDYLNFLLTGVKKQEYTNATTTQLVNCDSNTWDMDLIEKLGLPKRLFMELSMPRTVVGNLSKDIQTKVGFDAKVILPATHDTGSAVMSVPSIGDDTLYISSGTWSLFGCELNKPNRADGAYNSNFTNEGGFDYRFRFLKNIMGLWMIQSVKKEFEAGYDYMGKTSSENYTFTNICKMAEKADIDSIVDANSNVFLAPKSMIKAVQEECRRTNQKIPITPWEIARVIYISLAVCYKNAAEELEDITGKHYNAINVVGGGAKAEYLNRLTANATGMTVYAGPTEATALGNIGTQMIEDNVFDDLLDFRKCVYDSFDISVYEPSK